jgi:hypothetical protein
VDVTVGYGKIWTKTWIFLKLKPVNHFVYKNTKTDAATLARRGRRLGAIGETVVDLALGVLNLEL